MAQSHDPGLCLVDRGRMLRLDSPPSSGSRVKTVTTGRRPFMLVAAIGLAAAPVMGPLLADDVHVKGGAVFTGRIVEQTDTMITVDIGAGVVGVPKSRVERIVKGRSPLDEYDERAAKLQSSDADGWRTLGRWASHQGLSAQARQAYQNVLVVAPDDAEARQALGYVQVEGRWLTEEEGYRARGYVKVDGEWMTRSEAQVAQSALAADQARQDAERRANQAEAEKIQADARAEKAEERARKAEEVDPWNTTPTYWGGWGYGVGTFGYSNINKWPAGNPPIPNNPPKRGPR